MESAFGVEHGEVSKGLNPIKAFKAAAKSTGGKHKPKDYLPMIPGSPRAPRSNMPSRGPLFGSPEKGGAHRLGKR